MCNTCILYMCDKCVYFIELHIKIVYVYIAGFCNQVCVRVCMLVGLYVCITHVLHTHKTCAHVSIYTETCTNISTCQ